jgi:tetratricopeptide (TPR) repeat protein
MQPERISLSLVKVGILAVALSLGGTLAFAASGGGSSGSGASTPSCPKGEVWSGSKCAKSTSSLDDKQLYTQGRDLALAGRYTEALTALEAVKNQNDAMVLTMIGYSKRKLGNYDDGVALYQRALAIDPSNVNTHEYLGEAYAEKGKLDLAKAELVKVASVCGTTCEQYQDLAKAIVAAPSGTSS